MKRASLPTVLFSLMLIYSPQQRQLLSLEIKDLNELFLNSFLYRCNFTFPYTVSMSTHNSSMNSTASSASISNSSTNSSSAVVHAFSPHLSPNQQNKLLQEEFLKFTFKEGFQQMNPMPLHYLGSLLLFITFIFWNHGIKFQLYRIGLAITSIKLKEENEKELFLLFPLDIFMDSSIWLVYFLMSLMMMVFLLDIYFEFLQFEILFHYYQSAGHLPPPRPSNIQNSLIDPPATAHMTTPTAAVAVAGDLFLSPRGLGEMTGRLATTTTTISSSSSSSSSSLNQFNPQYRPLQLQQLKQKRKLRFQRISKRVIYYLTISILFPILFIDFLENYFFCLWDEDHNIINQNNMSNHDNNSLFWMKLISLGLGFYRINFILGHYMNLILFHYF